VKNDFKSQEYSRPAWGLLNRLPEGLEGSEPIYNSKARNPTTSHLLVSLNQPQQTGGQEPLIWSKDRGMWFLRNQTRSGEKGGGKTGSRGGRRDLSFRQGRTNRQKRKRRRRESGRHPGGLIKPPGNLCKPSGASGQCIGLRWQRGENNTWRAHCRGMSLQPMMIGTAGNLVTQIKNRC